MRDLLLHRARNYSESWEGYALIQDLADEIDLLRRFAADFYEWSTWHKGEIKPYAHTSDSLEQRAKELIEWRDEK